MGYADIGPFGSKLNRTPNLDRMAAEGRKFTCFYARPGLLAVACGADDRLLSEARAADSGVLFPAAAVGLNPAEHTVAELLKEAGYATACIGKWHLGDQPEFLPTPPGLRLLPRHSVLERHGHRCGRLEEQTSASRFPSRKAGE